MDLFTAGWSSTGGWSSPLPAWDGPGTLVLVFGSSDLLDDDTPLRAVVDAFPSSALIGCSTSGEILDESVHDGSLSVAVARFERTVVGLEVEAVSQSSSADVGRMVGKRLLDRGDDLAAIFVLSDGIDVNGSQLAEGLAEGTGGSAVITGGLAGDGSRFERTWVLVDGRPEASHVTAVGLYGTALEVGYGSDGGWTVLGPERVITRSEGNVLLELDGHPALELYKSYLGQRATGLPATALLFPLAIRADEDHSREAEHRHEEGTGEGKSDRRASKRCHADEQITGVRDAGICEQPFQIRLRQRGQISIEQGERGHADEQFADFR